MVWKVPHKVKDLWIYRGETLVQVISSIGSDCGWFAWPTSQLHVLAAINRSPNGNYFAWNEANDPKQNVTAYKEWPVVKYNPRHVPALCNMTGNDGRKYSPARWMDNHDGYWNDGPNARSWSR